MNVTFWTWRRFKRKRTQKDKKKIDNYRSYWSTDVSLKVFEWFSLSRRTNVETLKSDWDHSSKRFVWVGRYWTVAHRLWVYVEVCNFGKKEIEPVNSVAGFEVAAVRTPLFERREHCYADWRWIYKYVRTAQKSYYDSLFKYCRSPTKRLADQYIDSLMDHFQSA